MTVNLNVSVVIDNYNYGRFLGQAIESVLRQDFKGKVECIVVDDGSTDESREVIASFGNKICAILQENQGQAMAFNAGFSAAHGEFVCLLDSDDYWSPDKLRKTIALFHSPEIGVVQHFLRDVDVQGQPVSQFFPDWPSTYAIQDFLDHRTHLTATSGLVFRKSILEQIVPIPSKVFYYLDDMLVVKALLLSCAANVPEVLGFHRIHGSNFCAGGYWNVKKLELDMEMKVLFNKEIDPLLAKKDLRHTARYDILEDLEYFRRRILLYMFRGERRRAVGEWLTMLWKHGRTRRGMFRAGTCALALASPQAYLRFYEMYVQGVAFSRCWFRQSSRD